MSEEAPIQTPPTRLLGWLWKRYLRKYWKLLTVALVFMALESSMTAGFAVMMEPLFDDMFSTDDRGALLRVGLIVLALFFFRAVSSVAQKVVLNRAAQRSMADIRQDMLEHLMRLAGESHERTAKTLASSQSGVVFVEYVALLTLVTVIGSVSVVGLGIPLLRLFRFAQMVLSLPIP